MLNQTPQLGELQATHAASFGSSTLTGIGGIISEIAGVVLLIGASNPAFTGESGPGFELIFGPFFIVLGGYMLYRAYVNAGKNVRVYAGGLVSTTRRGSDSFRWDQISATWQQVTRHTTNGIPSGTTHIYTIQREDGRKAIFNDALSHVEQLGKTIQQQTFQHLFPRAVTSYMAGESLNFGKLTINQQGVSNGKELIPWGDVKQVQLNQGVISISKQGRWFKWSNVTVAQTPNVFVFLQLVSHIKGLN